jgi:hypothetical protein
VTQVEGRPPGMRPARDTGGTDMGYNDQEEVDWQDSGLRVGRGGRDQGDFRRNVADVEPRGHGARA